MRKAVALASGIIRYEQHKDRSRQYCRSAIRWWVRTTLIRAEILQLLEKARLS